MNKLVQKASSFVSTPIFQELPEGYAEKRFTQLKSSSQDFPLTEFKISDFKKFTDEGFKDLTENANIDFGIFQQIYEPLWLNVKWHADCYLVYAEYYFEAWVTKTSDPNGPRVQVENLEIRWRHGDVRNIERGNNVDMIAKEDRVYAYGLACGAEDICLYGLLNHYGATAFISSPNGCVYAS